MSSTRLLPAFAVFVSMLVAACGGGGGESSPRTGTVSISMADAPVDGYAKVIMVISQIRLLSDGGQDVIVLDEPKEVDFLALSNFSEVVIKREVAAGTFSKIRLILDSLTLVKPDGTTDVVQLNGLQRIDVNPQGRFQVRGGEEIIINVDLDLNRSIHIVTAGSGRVLFRPVIFALINTLDAFDKVFRVEGTIDSIATSDGTFTVCDIRRVSDDGAPSPNPRDVCVLAKPDATSAEFQTTYFDSNADPLSPDSVELAVNDPVVMYGKFVRGATSDTFVPDVIALGPRDAFARERGISSDFVPDLVDPSAPGTLNLDEVSTICLPAPNPREVSVAEETAVFAADPDGDEPRIHRSDITECRATEAEGAVVNPGAADEFLRAFVVLQGDPVGPGEELVGTLAVATGVDHYTLTPTAQPAPDQCVIVTSTTRIVQIQTVAGTSTVTVLDAVPVGPTNEVSAIGTRDTDNCLVATEVIREI